MRRWFPLVLFTVACARYTPAPLSPTSQLERYNQRSLSDTGLLLYFDSLGQSRPSGPWTARELAIAASWLRADRQVRLAEIRAADAAVVTAGGRPQPGASTDLEYAFSDPQASSRWGVALAGLFTVELGGKRGARIGRAKAAAVAARAAAAESEWEQAGRVYAAIAGWNRARQLVAAVRQERLDQDSVTGLTEARYQSGTLTRLDLARSTTDQRTAWSLEQSAIRDESSARFEVSAAAGLPGMAQIEIAAPAALQCSDESREALQTHALEHRWSVRRAAAEYQVAEGDLRLEVANASPDLTLGPGIFFDQGSGKFTLGLGLPSLPLNRNRGPIGEAEARRALAGARLMEAQEAVLSEVDAALASCASVKGQRAVSDSLIAATTRKLSAIQSSYQRGETGRLEVLTTQQEVVRVRRLQLEAEQRETAAALELERVVGAYGTRADGDWPTVK